MATKKSTSKQSTSKQSTKKTTGKAAPRKRTSSDADRTAGSGSSRSGSSAPRAAAGKRRTGLQIAQEAARQLLELTGREAEGVVAMERTDDGWRIEVEVLEVRRIPDTTDVLALYEVTVDQDGDLEGYRRLRRYGRGAPGEEREQ
ncbi:MAG: gas vesicle protein GvpO [Actinomycetes bacterium]